MLLSLVSQFLLADCPTLTRVRILMCNRGSAKHRIKDEYVFISDVYISGVGKIKTRSSTDTEF